MNKYTHVNIDNTVFKTIDGKYINYRGCDITGIIINKFKPFKLFPIALDQPKFYLITEEWNEVEEKYIPVHVQGPYTEKEEAELRVGKEDYIFLTTDKGIEEFKNENGLVDSEFAKV